MSLVSVGHSFFFFWQGFVTVGIRSGWDVSYLRRPCAVFLSFRFCAPAVFEEVSLRGRDWAWNTLVFSVVRLFVGGEGLLPSFMRFPHVRCYSLVPVFG